jgi:ribosomal protein L37AE/L43A
MIINIGCTAISDDEARQLLAYLKSELEPEANTHQCSDEFPCHRCTECDREEAERLDYEAWVISMQDDNTCSDEFPCHHCTECDKEEAARSSFGIANRQS